MAPIELALPPSFYTYELAFGDSVLDLEPLAAFTLSRARMFILMLIFSLFLP